MNTQIETLQADEATSLPTPGAPPATIIDRQHAHETDQPPPKQKRVAPKAPPIEAKTDEPAKLEREVVTKTIEEGAQQHVEQQRETKQKQLAGLSPVLQKLRNEKDSEAYAWINQVAGETEVNIAVIRKEPEWFTDPNTGQKKKTDGQVKVYSKWFTEQDIQNNHGGGRYQYVVRVKNQRGQWEFFGSRTVEIAGDPVLDDVPRQNAIPSQAAPVVQQAIDPTAGKAMDAMIGILGKQLERPAPIERGPSGADIAAMIERAVATATAPLLATITSMTTQLELKDKALEAARNAPPDAFRDMMMKSIMSEQDGRITALRASHESELRILKENAREDEKRRQDEWNRERDRIEKAHERELAALRLANEAAATSSKGMADITKTVLDAENKRLITEVTELRSELKEIRATKNPSIKDKVDELNSLKELLGDEDDEKGTLAQVMEVVGNLPVMAKLADKLTGTGEQPQAQQQQPLPRAKLIRDAQTGDVFRQTPQGLVPLKKKATQVTSDEGRKIELPPIDPEALKTAVMFMENAFRNKVEPKMFADSARPQIPPPILHAIRELGVTEFFTKVVKLEGTSSLMTMSGRNWSKKVAQYLLQGTNDEPVIEQGDPVAPIDPPPSE